MEGFHFRKVYEKEIPFVLLALAFSLQIFGQKTPKFSSGAEIAAIDKISKVMPFKSVLFVYQGSAHKIYHYKNFTKQVKRAFRKSNLSMDFDFDLDPKTGLKSDVKALPKRVENPNSFDLICYVNIKHLKAWDHHLYKKRKQSYVLLLELYQKDQLKKRIAITVRTYWTISTQNKAISKLIFEEIQSQ